MINGVIWCKSEDDLLKAAVKKYGVNQWKVVASLIKGKTDVQCKARWDAGHQPMKKNVEWTPEEDRTLFYQKKVLCNKIENIALAIGRSSVDCFNRYCFLR